MFSFFRKTTSTVPTQADDPNPHEQLQLRTPSPSVNSVMGTRAHRMDNQMDRSSPLREGHNGGPPDTPSPPPPPHTLDNDLGLITDPSALYELVSSVPAKTLQEYTLTHLIPPSADPKHSTQPVHGHIHTPSSITLTHLTSFFSSLTPPPKLHCVRCHKLYYDVENTDRSCLVAHDDESAEVERVGAGKGDSGTQYETLWGCCGKTVEGDGDMGPPDGWCYEGKHTTDTKRARFRADSTIHDDKLSSCKRLKCFEPKKEVEEDYSSDASSDRRSKPRSRKRRTTATTLGTGISATASSRKRARKADDDGEQEREGAEAEMEAEVDLEDAPVTASASPGSPGKGKGKAKAKEQVQTADDGEAQGTQAKKPRQRKKRAKTTVDEKTFKPDGTPSGDELDDMEVDESASVTSKAKRKPRAKNPANSKAKMKPNAKTSASDAESPTPGSATGRMSPPKSVPGSPTLSLRAGKGAASTKAAMRPRSNVGGGSLRKSKKLEEVIMSSFDGER